MAFEIKIICFGTKRDSFGDEVSRYVKMLRSFATVKINYIKPLSDKGLGVKKQLEKESNLIIKQTNKNEYLVPLAEEGKLFKDSPSFAKWLQDKRDQNQNITFIIGSAYGLSSKIKGIGSKPISLSPLTMPYSLCLVTLTEQLYRAYTILSKHPYHK